jgi:hypothetical protein
MWEHHRRKGTPAGTLVFEGSVNRWKGPGNNEFRENIDRAFTTNAPIRLVIVRTEEVARVESGEDASRLKKDFFVKPEVVGKVTEWDHDRYAITFTKATSPT